MRRDLINAEIANLRDLLPLPQSTRQRLSQLQLMALVCVYVRKANYFQQVFKRHNALHQHHQTATPNIGFSKALSGFLMMLTQNGKLLYISDNAAEYLGHSMEDLLIHGDSVYDIIDKQDHATIQAELNRNVPPQPGGNVSSSDATSASNGGASTLEGEHRMFLCRMNVSRNARRQMRFGDQKVVLVQGHYLSFLPLCSRNEPVFLATCTPIAMPETRECVVQGATNVFTTIHSMDMKIAHIDKNGEFHLGYDKATLQGTSWYNLIHSENLREAQSKHRLITQSEQDRSCILLVRMQRSSGDYTWVHVVLQVRDSPDSTQQPVIVCTNQVLNEREATIMLANSWLYHYYTVQSKIQFGMPLESAMRVTSASSTGGYYSTHQQPHGGGTAGINLGMSGAAVGMASVFGAQHAHHHHHAAAAYHHHHTHMGATYGGVYHAEGALELKEDQQLYGFQATAPSGGGGLEPVDYSQVNGAASSSQKSTRSTASPPPPKKRARNKLEPLYLHAERSPAAVITPEPDCYALQPAYASGGGGGALSSSSDAATSVIYATIVPTRPRLPNKALPPDPADFIEQWNPSPPWSESAQKASLDSFGSSHELSPCITTTPPTPTSATPHHGGISSQTIGPAFSFEWMSDPLVPVAYQQWPAATGDHHQHLSQHLAAAQQQQQQQHHHQQHHLQTQQQHQTHHTHLNAPQAPQLTLHGGVHVARVELAADLVAAGTGRADAPEPVEDRDTKN
ncbi:dys [Drosophila busckii]|uniref:Dys n=2 Tax=Drosophila busckii TaxID=30019 RepID=A0A0M4EMM2_DROBS|nr:dys [Drosophila busckii]